MGLVLTVQGLLQGFRLMAGAGGSSRSTHAAPTGGCDLHRHSIGTSASLFLFVFCFYSFYVYLFFRPF